MSEGETSRNSQERLEGSGSWFLSRRELEECSPSRRHGIDLKKESYLRKSYCTFLQDLGMRLKVPQVTIASAIIFCHRFFLRQSHTKNDRRTIATVCMFLAGKVEESPRPLKDVIIVAYEIIYKKDPAAVQRIKQKEVYEQQKELILLAERLVLGTLGFDLNLVHPYKPLVEAIKKFQVAQNALAQVAWNFVNDGLRTSLCLQFKPHHIAAGAIFLAAKFLKVKLPSDGDKVWWQEFDVTPRQLEDVSNQMLELYEQNKIPPTQTSEAEGSAGTGVSHKPPSKALASNADHGEKNIKSQGGDTTSRHARDHEEGPSQSVQNQNGDHGNTEIKDTSDQKGDGEVVNQQNGLEQAVQPNNLGETPKQSEAGSEHGDDGQRKNNDRRETSEAIYKIDKDKVDKMRAILEKRKKARGELPRKVNVLGDEDLIERELEEGIELGTKGEGKQSPVGEENGHRVNNGLSLSDQELDNTGKGYGSPQFSSRKRKAGGSLERE